MRKWTGALVVAAALVALPALPAGAGVDGGSAPILTIRKVVIGPVPAGTQFVETVSCDGEIIRPGGPGSSSGQRTYDAQGNPVTNGDFEFIDNGQCTVTETQTGGAASVTYECEGTVPPPMMLEGSGRSSPRVAGPAPPQPCQTSGPQSDPITVNIVGKDEEVTVTVTNTFVNPGTAAAPGAPAAAVVGEPRFTG
ncbi:MAG TPA: DUF5979 domain-containing protein [Acidimicrobiia bacterium]|nr:DUF5979 domain-containing protein [Acidimicrobiia bacterium]